MTQVDERGVLQQRLKRAVYDMRREAIETGDFEGWRISRYAKDAESLEQLQAAERRVAEWWRRHQR
jgi:hypothetical protein